MQTRVKDKTAIFSELSSVLSYPSSQSRKEALCLERELREENARAADCLGRFLSEVSALSQVKYDELYTRTFDLAPLSSPYLTTHLYGAENFQRGEFMTGLSQRYGEIGLAMSGELPDHLALVLRFASMIDEDERQDLISFCIAPALENMLGELNASENPFAHLIEAVLIFSKS